MTVEEFCLQKTQKGEMCVFMVNGRIVGTVWIDPDNLSMIHPAIGKKKFDSAFWSRLSIVTEH